MNRNLLLLFLLCMPFLGFSKGKESLPSVWIIKDSVSKKIHPDSVQLVFKLEDMYGQLMIDQHSLIMQVKTDGKRNMQTITNENRSFRMTLAKGKHDFEFYVNVNFEIIRFYREFESSHYYEIGLNFRENFPIHRDIMVEKPVIYLYSENKEAPFSLKIKTDADLQFTYPSYKDAWKGTTSPDGTIQINGKNYPYLFWDAQLSFESLDIDWSNAYQIQGASALQYLENQLDKIGFNAKEKTDFITYWAPRIKQLKYVEILFIQNTSVDPIAGLETVPHFNQNRIYLVFRAVKELKKQTPMIRNPLVPIDRSGSYLVEWGGIEIPSNL